MKKLLIALFILSPFSGYSQPRNLQVRLVSVEQVKPRKIHAVGVTMQGDSVYLKLGVYDVRNWKPGTWVTIWADEKDRQRVWTRKKIKLNN